MILPVLFTKTAPSSTSSGMHNWQQRLNTMFSYFMSCLLMYLIPMIAITSYLLWKPAPKVDLYVNHVNIVKGIEDPFMNRLTNLVKFNLSLDADFSKLMHWNTKQIVLYLVLEYTTDKFERNEIVVWDRIIRRSAKNYRLSINKLVNKYAVNDINDLLQYDTIF
jgi:hypothetical protein